MSVRLTVTILIASFFGMVAPGYAGRCEDLATLPLANGHVMAAVAVAPGPFTPPTPSPIQESPLLRDLPAFCRITASLTPTSDSDIRIEVWLPMSGWNGKLQSVGNGAWGGVISYPALGAALVAGYAAAATDTGHVGNTAEFVTDHPEKLVDYGYRAVHELTVASKIIVGTFFGSGPKRSYWNGCSTGGRQGL